MRVICYKCGQIGWLISRRLSSKHKKKYFYVEHYHQKKRFWHYIPLEKVKSLSKIIKASELKLRPLEDPWQCIPPIYVDLVKEYCLALQKHFKERLISICLFGSISRGETKPGDIDLLIIAKKLPNDLGSRIKETNYIDLKLRESKAYLSLKELGRSCLFSPLLYTPSEVRKHPPILLDLIEDGIILYDKDSFLKNELSLLLNRLRKLKSRKVITEKGYYWILKPNIKPPEIVEI